ncbi:Oidioi.mRNA.OKI2018_I69.chr1.g1132.t1.cds [Oikopleura dioica]|uniref:Oidioi.mRNA.OKI2018_I69.chr1.g1132.t1.cds n=1 Tax=Oikopleura dioica TaxID=34765 RepID=A0ABN7SS06_OIKDI|nr:Oidioi.mRNA.OKI2018_I69.chr1.g1132.t1.cds [Oikopleura dioica]
MPMKKVEIASKISLNQVPLIGVNYEDEFRSIEVRPTRVCGVPSDESFEFIPQRYRENGVEKIGLKIVVHRVTVDPETYSTKGQRCLIPVVDIAQGGLRKSGPLLNSNRPTMMHTTDSNNEYTCRSYEIEYSRDADSLKNQKFSMPYNRVQYPRYETYFHDMRKRFSGYSNKLFNSTLVLFAETTLRDRFYKDKTFDQETANDQVRRILGQFLPIEQYELEKMTDYDLRRFTESVKTVKLRQQKIGCCAFTADRLEDYIGRLDAERRRRRELYVATTGGGGDVEFDYAVSPFRVKCCREKIPWNGVLFVTGNNGNASLVQDFRNSFYNPVFPRIIRADINPHRIFIDRVQSFGRPRFILGANRMPVPILPPQGQAADPLLNGRQVEETLRPVVVQEEN